MRAALAQARMAPEDIDLVNTHATATQLGDVQECIAVRQVFGDAPGLFVNNTKSFIGHAMGAAGGLQQ
jgi:3-oxoacyl-[acyl-carrier-protein] synthase II